VKSEKRIFPYTLLLSAVVIVLMMLYKNSRTVPQCDCREIRSEGILRIVTEYNQPGYFVSDDTIAGFQYELSRAISELSGLEIRTFLEMSLSGSLRGLVNDRYDIIARNIPVTSEIKDHYLFTDPVVFNKQVPVQRTVEANHSIPPYTTNWNWQGRHCISPKIHPLSYALSTCNTK
jgi:ABC-type amino acid transport substrate-binding protein